MPKIDHSIYITVRNSTAGPLVDGYTEEAASGDLGKWIGFPSTIPAQSAVSFQLIENTWFTGTLGSFIYKGPDSEDPFELKVTQRCYYRGSNQIQMHGLSASLYRISFEARVGDQQWNGQQVDLEPELQNGPEGHPMHVTYTVTTVIDKFQLIEITAISAHPVRNSRGDLIAGQHTLWSQSEDYIDQNHGSFAPNIFKYDFGSQVAASGMLNVKVRPVYKHLLGREVILRAMRDEKRVIESDSYTFPRGDITDVIIQAHVIDPATSATPFFFNAEVTWEMDFKNKKYPLWRSGPGTTRLELYWIADPLHPAFRFGIPVSFLRNILVPIEKAKVPATKLEFYQDMTKRVFNDYSKHYNTVRGESGFGVNAQGGNFNVTLYLRSAVDKPQLGTLWRSVNSMDQAAMLQLCCSLVGGSDPPSWLYQMPFGYINTTQFVGVKNSEGALMDINNPTFGTHLTLAKLDLNDERRRSLKVHVYLGHSHPWKATDDVIYDACSGPHLGTETIAQYIPNVIDTKTTLYKAYPQAGPGSVLNVEAGDGIVTVDGRVDIYSQKRTIPSLTEPLSHLVNTAMANTVVPLAHTGWAHLPIWLNATLGDTWDVQYEQVSVGENGTQALWFISNTNVSDTPIRIHVNVASVNTHDGHLDMEQSAAIMKDNIGDILMSTEFLDIWTSGTLPGIEGVSLQYADHVAAGRIVLVAGNVVMDIGGMTSHGELLPYALRLLNRTVRRLCRSPPIVPVIQIQAIRMTSGMNTVQEPATAIGIITVPRIDTHFSLVFSVSCTIAAANAGSQGHGILFDRHIVEELGNGQRCIVEFRFIAREVGRHRVRVCVAELETMIVAKSDLEVEVVGVEEKASEFGRVVSL